MKEKKCLRKIDSRFTYFSMIFVLFPTLTVGTSNFILVWVIRHPSQSLPPLLIILPSPFFLSGLPCFTCQMTCKRCIKYNHAKTHQKNAFFVNDFPSRVLNKNEYNYYYQLSFFLFFPIHMNSFIGQIFSFLHFFTKNVEGEVLFIAFQKLSRTVPISKFVMTLKETKFYSGNRQKDDTHLGKEFNKD